MFYIKCVKNPCGSVTNCYVAVGVGELYDWSVFKNRADRFSSNDAFRRLEKKTNGHLNCECEFIVEQDDI